jgi:hypothetical protein
MGEFFIGHAIPDVNRLTECRNRNNGVMFRKWAPHIPPKIVKSFGNTNTIRNNLIILLDFLSQPTITPSK